MTCGSRRASDPDLHPPHLVTLADNFGDWMADDLGEQPLREWLESDHQPSRLTRVVDGVALAESHRILDPVIEDPRDVGDEDLAVLGGRRFLGVEGH